MSQLININEEYRQWVLEVCSRFRNGQIKAAVSVNSALMEFYWGLGKDIIDMNLEKKYGTGTMSSISQDLQRNLPGVKGLSQKNLYYIKNFYDTYNQLFENSHKLWENLARIELCIFCSRFLGDIIAIF